MTGTDNQTPATTPTAAAPATDAGTTITLNGRQFELRGMTAAQGAELYNVLPADYQQMADFYAQLAKSFERVQQIQLPPNMSFQNAWENTVNALDSGRGQLDANAPQYMRDMVAQIPQLAQGIPGVNEVVGTATATRDAAAGVGAFFGAGRDMLLAFPRALNALRTTGRELVGAAGGGVSDEQAHAFGAAYAGAIMYQGEARRALPFIDWPGQGSQFLSNPLQYSLAGLDWVALNVPVVNTVWPYVEAAAQFVGQLFQQGDRKTFSELLRESQQSAEQRRASGRTSYNDLVEERMRGRERDRAADQIAAANEIAGIRTAELAQLGNEGGVFTDQNGRTAAVNPTGDTPIIAAEPGADGQGEGRLDRIGAAWGAVGGNLVQTATENPIATGIAGYATYRLGRATLPPIVAGGRTIAAMPVAAYGNLINTSEGQAFSRAHARVEGLETRQAALQQQIDETTTRHNSTTGRAHNAAGRELRGLQSQMTSVTEELDGRTNWRGRQIQGARAELDATRNAFGARIERTPGAMERLERAERVHARADRIAGRAPGSPASATLNADAPHASSTAGASSARPAPGATAAAEAAPAATRVAAETAEHAAPQASRLARFASGMRGGRLALLGVGIGALVGVSTRGGGNTAPETIQNAAAGNHEALAEQQSIARANFVGTASGAGVGLFTVRLAQNRFPVLNVPVAPIATPVVTATAEVAERAAPSALSRIGAFGLRFLRAVPLIGGAVTTGTMSLSTPPGATADEQGLNGFQILERDHAAGRISSAHYATVRALQVAYCGSGLGGFIGWGAQEVAQTSLSAIDANMINRYFPETLISTVSSAVRGAGGGQAPAQTATAQAGQANFNGDEGNQRFNTQMAALVGEANVSATRNLFQAGGITTRNALDTDRNGQITGEELQSGYAQVIQQAQRTGNTNLARQLAMHVRDVHPGAEIVLAEGGAPADLSTIGVPAATGALPQTVAQSPAQRVVFSS